MIGLFTQEPTYDPAHGRKECVLVTLKTGEVRYILDIRLPENKDAEYLAQNALQVFDYPDWNDWKADNVKQDIF